MDNLLTISEIARRSGVASSALRFYEERGLITSERTGSGHRRFRRSALRRVAFVVFAQKIGLTLLQRMKVDSSNFFHHLVNGSQGSIGWIFTWATW